LGGCQIDATWLKKVDSLNLISKVNSTKLIKEIRRNEGNESVWQQWQKQNGEHKSTSFVWLGLCFTNSKETEFVLAACTSMQGMAVKTIIYTDNITAIYFICKFLLFLKYNDKDTPKFMQLGCKVIFYNLSKLL